MKKIFLFISLAFILNTNAQESFHFLMTSNSTVSITDPICKEMAAKSKEQLVSQIEYLNKSRKKSEQELNKLDLFQQSYFELLQQFKSDPDHVFPIFPITQIIFLTYRESIERNNLFFSAQKATLKSIGPANIEISIKNVRVSSSETMMDMEVRNLANTSYPTQSTHFSCPTGRLLSNESVDADIPWIMFWSKFYHEVKTQSWLEEAIMKVEPKLTSKAFREKQMDEAINQQGLTNESRLITESARAKEMLKNIQYEIPLNKMVAVLISQDKQKLSILTCEHVGEVYFDDNFSEEIENKRMTKWNFALVKDQWHIDYSYDFTSDSLDQIRDFYQTGFNENKQFKEENWIQQNENERQSDEFTHIEFVHEKALDETEKLVRNVIQPKMNQLLSEENSKYISYYQRINKRREWNEEDIEKIITQDILLSNPEKTAFIYPVILYAPKEEGGSYEDYAPEEYFKFYVLLKSSDGSYKMYDWIYFKPFAYYSNFSLLRCAERHLEHISNYTSDQEIIHDSEFWEKYVFKSTAGGFDYLTPVILSNESISITKNEFDAQVQESIDLLLEHDVVDLYTHQLKQLIRCLNTIEKNKLNSPQYNKLTNLSKEIYFQKRLNRIQEPKQNYYPNLQLEYGVPLKEHSYYQIR